MRIVIIYIGFLTLVYSCNLANRGNENQTNNYDTATFSSDQKLRENEEYLKDSLIQNETNLDSTEFISSINQDNDTTHLYENVGDFNEGYAAVQLNNKWGFIDKSGKVVITCKYDNKSYFHEGFALVEQNEKYGYIDITGKNITPFIYEFQSDAFCNGMCRVKRDGKWGFIDKSGKEVIAMKYNSVHNFHEGLAAVQSTVYSELHKTYVKAWGFIDIYGKEITEFKYNIEKYEREASVGDFKDGLAKVNVNNKFGFINKAGKEVIPVIYSKVGDFHDGLVWVTVDTKMTTRGIWYKYLDKNGNQTISETFAIAGNFYNGIAIVGKCKEGYGCANPRYYIDKNGNVVNKKSELLCVMDNCGGRGQTENDEGCKFGFKDFTGKIIIPFQYNRFSYFYNGIAVVIINNKYGYINETGKNITPIKYDFASDFVGDLSCVSLNNKQCIINKEGFELSDFYDKIFFDYQKPSVFFPVKENNKWGCIDVNGKLIIPIKYEEIGKPQENMLAVKLNDKWGFIALQ
jgi:hypothetical protein